MSTSEQNQRGNEPENQNQNQNSGRNRVVPLLAHVKANKIDFALLCTRLGTVIFTILYLIPLFNVNSYTCYQRALMSNAATSALRLHQRLPNVRLTREFVAQLLLEDSCHYLFYSLIFLNTYPMTLVLLPIALFGILLSSTYVMKTLEVSGNTDWSIYPVLSDAVRNQQRNILRLVAFTEIALMFFTIGLIFVGRVSLLIPFVYYRFITLRYASRRNPYTRQMFYELRLIIEHHVNKPAVPDGIKFLVHRVIAFISRMAPASVQ